MINTAFQYAFLLAVVDVIVLSILKLKHLGTKNLFDTNWIFVIAFLLYGFQALIFYKSLDYSGLVRSNLIWDLMSDLLVTFFGLYMFSEILTISQGIGVVFAILAIILLK